MTFVYSFLTTLRQKFAGIFDVKKTSKKTLADYNREELIREGADQFKKLAEKGLSIPVAHL